MKYTAYTLNLQHIYNIFIIYTTCLKNLVCGQYFHMIYNIWGTAEILMQNALCGVFAHLCLCFRLKKVPRKEETSWFHKEWDCDSSGREKEELIESFETFSTPLGQLYSFLQEGWKSNKNKCFGCAYMFQTNQWLFLS